MPIQVAEERRNLDMVWVLARATIFAGKHNVVEDIVRRMDNLRLYAAVMNVIREYTRLVLVPRLGQLFNDRPGAAQHLARLVANYLYNFDPIQVGLPDPKRRRIGAPLPIRHTTVGEAMAQAGWLRPGVTAEQFEAKFIEAIYEPAELRPMSGIASVEKRIDRIALLEEDDD